MSFRRPPSTSGARDEFSAFNFGRDACDSVVEPLMMPALRRCVLFAVFAASLIAAEELPALESARALYEDGQLAAADAAEAQFWLGEIALRRNDPETAISWLEKSVALAPSVSRYHHRLGDAYGRAAQKASIFTALGFARKCLTALREAVAVDPANLDARYSLLLF